MSVQSCWVLVQVRTFDVIPVSPSLGLLAFVADTESLKAGL
jgi:phosphatidylinositol kinase/protein kinase (PI-3  family)